MYKSRGKEAVQAHWIFSVLSEWENFPPKETTVVISKFLRSPLSLVPYCLLGDYRRPENAVSLYRNTYVQNMQGECNTF